jgi:hypothetical protein
MCSSDLIKYRRNQEWAHWAHNAQYEDKQTYTIHSTKTNKDTRYTVRRQTNIHNTTEKTEHMRNTDGNKIQWYQEW